MMSEYLVEKSDEAEADAEVEVCCANCGLAEIDDVIILIDCPHCDRARYCGGECQQRHLEIHEAACKERVAELRDEILFKQPESSHWGDCPICFLPLPLDGNDSTIYSCCGKLICEGCHYANQIREFKERIKSRCVFCRKPLPLPDNNEEIKRNHEKRAELNDPIALQQISIQNYDEGEYDRAIEYWTRAAELGDALSHYNLSILYREGKGVEKDEQAQIYHLEEAAIAGHPIARYNLGCIEANCKSYDRAVKHLIIAANLGYDDSIQALKECYKEGHVSKDDFAAALRAHQAAVDAMKSPQRESAAKAKFLVERSNDKIANESCLRSFAMLL